MLVKRDFTLIYKQTILGPAWVIIQPLLTTLVFTVIFGSIAGLPTDGMPKFMFYMGGNIAWQFFAHCLTTTSNTFITNRNLFGKVYFPRLCMPVSTVVSQLINFFVQFVMFIGFVIYFAVQPGSAVQPDWRLILLTPVLLLQLGMLGLGFGVTVSALTTRYRDLAMLVSFGTQLWMYFSPVTYSTSMIAEKFPQLVKIGRDTDVRLFHHMMHGCQIVHQLIGSDHTVKHGCIDRINEPPGNACTGIQQAVGRQHGKAVAHYHDAEYRHAEETHKLQIGCQEDPPA
jgi:lipopolysaccharide transport system permease protein